MITETQAVTLVSPFPESELAKFWQWFQENQGAMMDDQCPKSIDDLRAKNSRDLENGALTFGVMQGDECVGAVWGEHLGDGIYAGHLVFERDALSPAEKISASRDALKEMFTHGARKISWMLYPDNRAFAIFLLKLGATYEGYLRKGTRQKGNLADLVLMASFAEDFA